ncbi:hypothetical protein [Spirillospora sp. CA-128828]|uniref:hypothetical protein n=1 Tax=Spirillospora sp. CA-128828 TaxID=3240033 RepID=UPI003D93CE7E
MQLDSQNAVIPLIRATLPRDSGATGEGPTPVSQIIEAVRDSAEGEAGIANLAVGTAAAAGAVTEGWAAARGGSVTDFLELLPRHTPDFAGHVPEIMRALFDPDPQRPFFAVMGDLVGRGEVTVVELITSLAEYSAGLVADLERDGIRTADECLAEAEDVLREWAARG